MDVVFVGYGRAEEAQDRGALVAEVEVFVVAAAIHDAFHQVPREMIDLVVGHVAAECNEERNDVAEFTPADPAAFDDGARDEEHAGFFGDLRQLRRRWRYGGRGCVAQQAVVRYRLAARLRGW